MTRIVENLDKNKNSRKNKWASVKEMYETEKNWLTVALQTDIV